MARVESGAGGVRFSCRLRAFSVPKFVSGARAHKSECVLGCVEAMQDLACGGAQRVAGLALRGAVESIVAVAAGGCAARATRGAAKVAVNCESTIRLVVVGASSPVAARLRLMSAAGAAEGGRLTPETVGLGAAWPLFSGVGMGECLRGAVVGWGQVGREQVPNG